MPQNSNFPLPRGHRFRPKFDFTVMALNHVGEPLGPSWGQWGPIGSIKRVKTVKNYHAPKFEFWLPGGHRFRPKFDFFTVMAPNHDGDPLGSILGLVGSHWVQKMAHSSKKLPCPKIRIFHSKFPLHRVHRFRPKFDLTVMAPIHGGDPLGSILGLKGSHWVQKMGQSCRKLPCPKIRIFDYTAVIDFGQNSTWRLWRQISVGTP